MNHHPLDELLAELAAKGFKEADALRAAGYPETAAKLEHLAEVLGDAHVPTRLQGILANAQDGNVLQAIKEVAADE